MEYRWEGLDQEGRAQSGTENAANEEAAIALLQRRGLTLTAFGPKEQQGILGSLKTLSFFNTVSSRSIVVLSRQLATLFEAGVSPLRIFQLLGEQAETPYLRQVLTDISDELQAGKSISQALSKYPKVFSDFYVNMVRAGEETGKLNQTFLFLADHIDKSYEVTSKVRNALIYPAFVIVTFVSVMILMITYIIPKIGDVLTSSGGTLPIYTQFILGMSGFFVNYGVFLLIICIIGGYFLVRYARTPAGRMNVSKLQITVPYVGNLYQKLYLSRIADNMHVMLVSGISTVRALEITGQVVQNGVYENIIHEAVEGVKAGQPMHEIFSRYPKEIPSIMVQMLQIGNETGETANVLDRLGHFYDREVTAAVDTLVSMIEPVMIVILGVGVAFLLASVLVPIYNTASQL